MDREKQRALFDDLTVLFCKYIHNSEKVPLSAADYFTAERECMERYRNDVVFNAKVSHLVMNVMGTIQKHIK